MLLIHLNVLFSTNEATYVKTYFLNLVCLHNYHISIYLLRTCISGKTHVLNRYSDICYWLFTCSPYVWWDCKCSRAIGAAIADLTLQRRLIFVIFHNIFLHISHAYIFLFNHSIASVGTDKHIAKILMSKCPILKFLWDFEKCQNGPKVNVECVSSSSFLLVQQFPRFLNTF